MNNDLSRLHEFIVKYYDREELRTLCFDLGVNDDALGGEGLSGKARELVLYLGRQGGLEVLLEKLRRERPMAEAGLPVEAAALYEALPAFEAGAAPAQRVIHTGGGAYVEGRVETGGDFVGRDKSVHGDEVHGDKVDARGAQIGVMGDRARVEGGIHFGGSGDTFNLSGDFRGANVNIQSTLSHVTQTIGALPGVDLTTKAELERLVQQLNAALQQAPPDQTEDAEAVAQSAELLVETASQEKPNKRMVEITGEGLKQAAQNIAHVMPTVLGIATQIVETVGKVVK